MTDATCVSQLLSITHNIYKSIDYNPPFDVRESFLHISKAFGKGWHNVLISKLQTYVISGKLLKFLKILKRSTTTGCFKWAIFQQEFHKDLFSGRYYSWYI